MKKCIDRLLKFINNIPIDYRILVTSDSSILGDEATKIRRVYVTSGKIYHPQHEAKEENAFIKSFIDLYLLMDAEKVYLLRTGLMYRSGFPRFAALLGKKPFKYINF